MAARKKSSVDPGEKQFLKAIEDRPGDRTVRHVYADWLEERNDPRAELIRVEEEMRGIPIYSDRYWQLKPRRAQLRKTLPRAWVKRMGYQVTAYEPVFREVPDGWKERWRLIREFAERWYDVPMPDVGGRRKEVKKIEREHKVVLPPSLQEWVAFIADLEANKVVVDIEYGDETEFVSSDDELAIVRHYGNRIVYSVAKKHLEQPDPPVAWNYVGTWNGEVPHLTALASEFIRHLIPFQGEETAGGFRTKVKPTKKLLGQLAKVFPVQSKFGECLSFEGSNMIAWIAPNWFGPSSEPAFNVEVREPISEEDIPDCIWQLSQGDDALGSRRGIFDA